MYNPHKEGECKLFHLFYSIYNTITNHPKHNRLIHCTIYLISSILPYHPSHFIYKGNEIHLIQSTTSHFIHHSIHFIILSNASHLISSHPSFPTIHFISSISFHTSISYCIIHQSIHLLSSIVTYDQFYSIHLSHLIHLIPFISSHFISFIIPSMSSHLLYRRMNSTIHPFHFIHHL